MSTNKLESKITNLPNAPGVYLFEDNQGSIIYIGKAKSLKVRVRSYFRKALDAKTQVMVSKVADLKLRLTSSEAQAQLLEAALIKQHQPHYNIDLKDDKSFPWIRFTDEEFPAVSVCRIKDKMRNDKSLYLGPYTNAMLLRQALRLLRRIIGFRSCKTMPKAACLYYRLKLCPAPCIKKITVAEYREVINQIKLFLDSKYELLIRRLSVKMQALAKDRQYEAAAQLRDQILALAAIGRGEQDIDSHQELEALRVLLRQEKPPRRIEAFDISNIHGQEAVGSMVSFLEGRPDKNNYRRFRIKTVTAVDDYRMLAEVVARRYLRVIKDSLPRPELILIDGGKAHLLTAARELGRLNLRTPLISIAKEKENIYIFGRQAPVHLKEGSAALNLIRRVRDEAHRFALSYHRLLRRKKIIDK